MTDAVLAILENPDGAGEGSGHRFADPDAPAVGVLDLGISRGDGVFETIGVHDGRAQALAPHLARLGRSAAMLELPVPDRTAWTEAVEAVAARLPADREAFVKLVYTRGVEGTGRPTGWVYGKASPDNTAARTRGIAVAVLERGLPSDIATAAPWLLQGAKTLSYAMNMAALREARRRGADDVLFVSADGILLEGATSNLLVRQGDRLLTPSTELGILPGTTQGDAFRWAEERGLGTAYAILQRSALVDADGLWLLSSVRNAAPIRAIDGVERPVDAAFTAELNAYLTARRE